MTTNIAFQGSVLSIYVVSSRRFTVPACPVPSITLHREDIYLLGLKRVYIICFGCALRRGTGGRSELTSTSDNLLTPRTNSVSSVVAVSAPVTSSISANSGYKSRTVPVSGQVNVKPAPSNGKPEKARSSCQPPNPCFGNVSDERVYSMSHS